MDEPRAEQNFLLLAQGLGMQYGPKASARRFWGTQSKPALRAVDGVSIAVRAGETLGIVGESGSGKSTLGRLIVGLEEPTAGTLTFDAKPLPGKPSKRTARQRSDIQIILQDPYSTLNPFQSVLTSVEEVLKVHGNDSKAARAAEAAALLSEVGLPSHLHKSRPDQLSGGGRQRASIARALAVKPRLLVADEPVSALDVSVQAQVLNLFEKLKRDLKLTYVFITHDLSVVRRLSDRIAVMYLGRIVEEAAADDLFHRPLHPYTLALLNAAPSMDGARPLGATQGFGDAPSAFGAQVGCAFRAKCPQAMAVCSVETPQLIQPLTDRTVACHLHQI